MTEAVVDPLLSLMRRMLRAMVTDAFESDLDPACVGQVDGLLWAVSKHPESSAQTMELLQATAASHRKLRGDGESCSCGLTPACHSENSGVMRLARGLFFFDDDDVASIDAQVARLEARQHTRRRDALEDRVLGTLRRARREMSAREIADQLGGGVSGQQVGAVLKRLREQNQVQQLEYRNPRSGFTTNNWIAAQWAETAEDAADDRVGDVVQQLRDLSDA